MPPPNADNPGPEPRAAGFDDRPLMAAGALAFGLAIPWLTGLYGPVGPDDPRFWAGAAGFIVLAFAIWAGNRWLLFKQRQHFDWFRQPWRKLALLVSANVLYTAPLTAAAIAAWLAWSGQAVESRLIELVVATNVICVVFVTHAYETVFLIREREADLVHVERLERARVQAELTALKGQVDPHFLFNSLNTLGHLIVRDVARAREFCDALAEVYRYLLAVRERDLVALADELDFLRRYHRLLALRFGDAIELDIAPEVDAAAADYRLAPLALQALLENAVKHNQAGREAPLRVEVTVIPGPPAKVRVCNLQRPRTSALPGAGLGLANLDDRCRLLTGRGLERLDDGALFAVAVPLA